MRRHSGDGQTLVVAAHGGGGVLTVVCRRAGQLSAATTVLCRKRGCGAMACKLPHIDRQAMIAPERARSKMEIVLDIKLYGFSTGSVTLKKKAVIDDGTGMIELPIPAFLIVHPLGNVLFDTGLHADLADPSSARLGELSRYSTISFSMKEHVTRHLATLGLKPEDISIVVNSHLHYDHAGGNSCFPHATMVVQRVEWEAANDPAMIARNAYNPEDYRDNGKVELVEGDHDLFGDGTLTLTPTFGHTPGHQCLLVKIGGRRIVLAADASYTSENLERRMVSRLSFDIKQAKTSLEKLAAFQSDGWEIMIGHDGEQWSRVPKIPHPIA
jgi:N-acyl homoserine lactone hydrolase